MDDNVLIGGLLAIGISVWLHMHIDELLVGAKLAWIFLLQLISILSIVCFICWIPWKIRKNRLKKEQDRLDAIEYQERCRREEKEKKDREAIERWQEKQAQLRSEQRWREEIEEEARKEAEKREFRRQCGELYEFKKMKNSLEALPLNHSYSNSVISQTEWMLKKEKEEREVKNRIKREAIEYYETNDFDTVPQFSEKIEPEIYALIRQEFSEGKHKKKTEKIINLGEPLFLPFYRTTDLSEKERKNAIAQGFHHARGNYLDGKICPGGFYIKPESNESAKHFITKHLIKELHPKLKVEHSIGGKRVDVAFVKRGLKLGIEIETGTNKINQLADKIPWLNTHFDIWIFVVNRKNLSKYRLMVDDKKSFCLTPKQARDKVLDIMTPIPLR